MANTIASQWRSFWHTITSNDRHASYDSPYRSGNHVPLPQSRHTPLTSVATSAFESRTDLNSEYGHDIEAGNGFINSNGGGSYSPGMRKQLQRQSSGMDAKMDGVAPGEIQMQSFSDGLPPPPPVSHAWKRIDRWLEDNYEELFENLGQPATINDVNELEHEMDCTLPQEVRESLQIHDGQERGGQPTGMIFGCMLLDCEEIIQEWQNWRTVNEAYLTTGQTYEIPQTPIKAFAGASSSAVPVAQAQQAADPAWRQELQDKQDSQPTNAVQKAYAHPAWIPLARDWGGNNICVDLAPGPTGKWGQIILMGRDYDCKYVVARSWSAFLASVADDMNTDKWYIDEDTAELKLREFRQPGVEPAYIEILRWRADQKYGRKRPARRPLRINSNVAQAAQNGLSPYASPTNSDDRGRSPNRMPNGKAPANPSPRAHVGSPLARVTEESQSQQQQQQSLKLDTGSATQAALRAEKLIPIETPRASQAPNGGIGGGGGGKPEKLVPVDSPRRSNDDEDKRGSFPLPKSRLSRHVVNSEDLMGSPGGAAAGVEEGEHGAEARAGAEEMRDVDI
ncbi:Cell wall assembly regulator [Friedmanniomyces endolithicus]|nr:Cell wall assembly regulator [Friedmanniomyces endolithicus]